MYWLIWMCIDLAIVWFCVQTLTDVKQIPFC